MEINKTYPCHSSNYRKGRRDSIKYIVIHYVGATGGALDNVKYYGSAANIGASAHFYVGHASENGAIYQSVAPEDCAWHCGSETGKYYSECRNDSSIGIEMCCHKAKDGTWYFDDITVEKAIEFTRYLMNEYGIDASRVIRHYDVTHKTCPAPFVDNPAKWKEFKNAIQKEAINMPKTVYSLNDVHVQVIDPWNFKIYDVDERKKNINFDNYANAGFFATLNSGETIPVGNLVIDGHIITDAKNQADWLSTARKKQTTLVVHNDNTVEFVQTDDMMTVPAVKYAISGVPIIRNGYRVGSVNYFLGLGEIPTSISHYGGQDNNITFDDFTFAMYEETKDLTLDAIKAEGYSGAELYDTWHGFIGIRANRLVYVAAKLDFELMVYLLEVLGIRDAIKLDGGGSFILHNGSFEVATPENRRINNVITWEG